MPLNRIPLMKALILSESTPWLWRWRTTCKPPSKWSFRRRSGRSFLSFGVPYFNTFFLKELLWNKSLYFFLWLLISPGLSRAVLRSRCVGWRGHLGLCTWALEYHTLIIWVLRFLGSGFRNGASALWPLEAVFAERLTTGLWSTILWYFFWDLLLKGNQLWNRSPYFFLPGYFKAQVRLIESLEVWGSCQASLVLSGEWGNGSLWW